MPHTHHDNDRRRAAVAVVLWVCRAGTLLCVVLWFLSCSWWVFIESQFTDAWGIKHGAVFGRHIGLPGRQADAQRLGLSSTNRQWTVIVMPAQRSVTWFPDYTTAMSTRAGSIPFPWIVAIINLPECAAYMARRRRRLDRAHRASLGLCPGCEYSRAGLSPSAACPECGEGAAGVASRA